MVPRVDIRGNVAEPGSTQINNVNLSTAYTVDDLDRACLRALRCPNTQLVRNRLKEKDKYLPKVIDWILRDSKYKRWRDQDNVSLLWIKGGPGKGKTMMTIGLIDQISFPQEPSTLVTYFFCQYANYELNTIEAIIKGLIRNLVTQKKELNEPLRHRWDTALERFNEDLTSWRTLWDIFLEMLDLCKSWRVYVIVDALDECQGDDMAEFLKLVVRTGFNSKIKWLLTSRPLDSAERELLAGSDQVMVSLDLNSKYIAEAVKTYVATRAAELDRRQKYGPVLRQKVEAELIKRAEDTFLWVHLVCKRLDSVCRAEVFTTIQDLPPGLPGFYRRIFDQLSEGDSAVAKGCMRLLKAMLTVYRPLAVEEVGSVTGLSNDEVDTEALIDRCASFVRNREASIEFVHQSARDYLANDGQPTLDSYGRYGHGEISLSCLSYLSRRLEANIFHLRRPDSTSESIKELKDKNENALLVSVDYAATFWVEHVKDALKDTGRMALIQHSLSERGEVVAFLGAKLLEWFECLSWLDQLPRAIEALKALADMAQEQNPSLSMLAKDATRFLLRHYQTIAIWPLQVYSSAVVFSPETSVVREANLARIPSWLRRIPQMEETWASLIQTLVGHSYSVSAVAFSPDGQRIASGSVDNTVKLWDITTGGLQKTLVGHSSLVNTVAFSPDGQRIASGSADKTVKLWDITTGSLQKTLVGHSGWVNTVAFSPDGQRIASGSADKTVKLWDTTIGGLQKTLAGHSNWVSAVAFSPDGQRIASGSDDKTVKLWDTTIGGLQKTLVGHSSSVSAVAFSPDSQRIASGSVDNTVKLWDTTTGGLQKTLAGHSSWVSAVAFSPDGQRIASGSDDKTVKLWDTTTGGLQKTLAGHSILVSAVAFSPDGQRIASGSYDNTVKLWDVTKSLKVSKFLGSAVGSRLKFRAYKEIKMSEIVESLQFSSDGQYILTNIGRISIQSMIADTSGLDPRSLEDLRVNDMWIYYGAIPVLRLPPDFVPECFDKRGNRVAIGFDNGRVLSFDIDRKQLQELFCFS